MSKHQNLKKLSKIFKTSKLFKNFKIKKKTFKIFITNQNLIKN